MANRSKMTSKPTPRTPTKSAAVRAPGGGGSSKYVQPPIRTGSANLRKVNPGGVDRIGQQTGSHATEKGEFKPKPTPLYAGDIKDRVRLGNDMALDVGRGSPGAARILHGQSGTQKQWGPAAQGTPMAKTPGGGPQGLGFPDKGK